MQRKRRDLRTVERRACIERVVAHGIECAPVIAISAGLRHNIDLRAARGAAFGSIDRGAHTELGYSIQRNVEAGVGLLRLLLHAAGVKSIERKIAFVQGMPVEADAALRAVTVIDG